MDMANKYIKGHGLSQQIRSLISVIDMFGKDYLVKDQ
jgi:hypothetical protein